MDARAQIRGHFYIQDINDSTKEIPLNNLYWNCGDGNHVFLEHLGDEFIVTKTFHHKASGNYNIRQFYRGKALSRAFEWFALLSIPKTVKV